MESPENSPLPSDWTEPISRKRTRHEIDSSPEPLSDEEDEEVDEPENKRVKTKFAGQVVDGYLRTDKHGNQERLKRAIASVKYIQKKYSGENSNCHCAI